MAMDRIRSGGAWQNNLSESYFITKLKAQISVKGYITCFLSNITGNTFII